MIDAQQLLKDLLPLMRRLEDDLRERSQEVPDLEEKLRNEWQLARQRERTAQTYEAWRDDYLSQAAAMWILGCVFVRFLEDNALVAPPRIAGPGQRLRLARDQHTLYFQQYPLHSDRDYLYFVFESVAALPGAGPLFDRRQNPVWSAGVSGDASTALLEFFQRVDAESGALVHDFTDAEWRTRFLGDLYQDLSASARKKYALLQTPDFVLQFILDRTLTPAIDEFGFREVRLIDPACGSGHFLLAAFDRLFRLWSQHEPGRNARDAAQQALNQVSGVDLNPFAVAIARFRLLLVALKASGITRLADAPAFAIDVAAGDSLLHGPRPGNQGARQRYLDADSDPLGHVYDTEDAADLRRILGRRYHVVVGNPPYITPKDAALNKAYRERFESCHMKYSLAVPFMERLFDLAIAPENGEVEPAGYVGMITANSFMKREFGRLLIEEFLPKVDLIYVVDTERAYIPGHTTHTAILFGRHRSPQSGATTRLVMGIRREKGRPVDPAKGLVWTAILRQVDRVGSESEFVSVNDVEQSHLHNHPWSIGGGGAAELKEQLETGGKKLNDIAESIGITSFTLEDDLYLIPKEAATRRGIPASQQRLMVEGDVIRDWQLGLCSTAVFPYDDEFEPLEENSHDPVIRYLWSGRTNLANNKMFGGKTKIGAGLRWFEYGRLTADKLRTPLSIAFAEVATHNHFVLDRGGKVFKQTAPVIKLSATATEEDHLALLGLLNSSTACFWIKQVCQRKGGTGLGGGIYDEEWEFFYQMNGTRLLDLPLVDVPPSLVHELDRSHLNIGTFVDVSKLTDRKAESEQAIMRAAAIGRQEELDWAVYRAFGLLQDGLRYSAVNPPHLNLGERAFEIVMARQINRGELDTTWFERQGATPLTVLPSHWPGDYKRVVESRITLIETDRNIGLIEQPEYKRRWNLEPWDTQVERAVRKWLLDRLESKDYWSGIALTTVARLADCVRRDEEFMRAAALYRKQEAFDITMLVSDLVESESVPFLPVLRYKASGLRRREAWEHTWELQRREDAIDARTMLPDGHPQRSPRTMRES